MARGVVLNSPVELILLLQRGFTIALSGYNARYFWLYFSCQRKRRVGLLTLVMINLAIALESLAFVFSTLLGSDFSISAGVQVAAASLSLAVAATLTALVLRRRLKGY